MTDYSKLIPEMALWNNGQGIDIGGWLSCQGNVELAIAFSTIFWPEFTEHEGSVLFADFSRESYCGFMKQFNGDKRQVQRVMNHRHILDFFAWGKKATREQVAYLGRVLREIWETKLRRDFPARQFKVDLDEGPFDDLLEYVVTFWQE